MRGLFVVRERPPFARDPSRLAAQSNTKA